MPPETKPTFLITIDTEGDNAWARPKVETTENSRFLPRFQALAEKYGLKPTWLTDWEMAECPVFREFARDALARGTAEIGMHLHAWSSPPLTPLTDNDRHWQPFLLEHDVPTMREKIARLTDLLRSTFESPIISHRAGRWGFDARYARLLVEFGYQIDCSVTPGISWRNTQGAPPPIGHGGPDFTRFPARPYFVDLDDISRPGNSPLLELPMTIHPAPETLLGRTVHRISGMTGSHGRRLANRFFPTVHWLRPDGRNQAQTICIADEILADGEPYAEWMLHSSEFMPGGSPRFPDARSIEQLFDQTEALFAHVAGKFRGMTLAEFGTEIGPQVLSPTASA